MSRDPAFKKNGCLSEDQAERLHKVRAAVASGLSQGGAAARCGLNGPHLSSFLGYVLGEYGWPPRPALLDRVLALPVLPQREIRARSQRGKHRPRPSRPRRDAKAGPVMVVDEAEAAIEARVRAREAERRAYEDRWLEEEQTKYRLPRRGTPLSDMSA